MHVQKLQISLLMLITDFNLVPRGRDPIGQSNADSGNEIVSHRSTGEKILLRELSPASGFFPGEGTWVFFGWVCAARDSKLALLSKKNFP